MIRILLVDDDKDVLLNLGERLELEGFQVTSCRSYIEAADHLSPRFNGVVITDMRMPGKSGLDVIDKANKVDPSLPVILLTAYADTASVVQAMRGGAVTVIEKPCDISSLISLIKTNAAQRTKALNRRSANIRRAAGRPKLENSLHPQVKEFERALILKALKSHGGNKEMAAQSLKISKSALYSKIKE